LLHQKKETENQMKHQNSMLTESSTIWKDAHEP